MDRMELDTIVNAFRIPAGYFAARQRQDERRVCYMDAMTAYLDKIGKTHCDDMTDAEKTEFIRTLKPLF